MPEHPRFRSHFLRALGAFVLGASLVAAPHIAGAQPVCKSRDTFDHSLIAQAQDRVSGKGVATQSEPDDPNDLGLSTTGEAHFIAIRVSFPASDDGSEAAVPIPSEYTKDDLEAVFNGGGSAYNDEYPYESLKGYYKRASYGRLDISCVGVADYTAQHERSYYETGGRVNDLFYEALDGVKDQIDLTKGDANNDGLLDGVFLQYAGDDGPWGSTW